MFATNHIQELGFAEGQVDAPENVEEDEVERAGSNAKAGDFWCLLLAEIGNGADELVGDEACFGHCCLPLDGATTPERKLLELLDDSSVEN